MKPFLILSLVGMLASPIAAAATLSTKAQDVEEEKPKDSIGVATMNDDGTIVLRLRTSHPTVAWAKEPWCIRRLTPNIRTYSRTSDRFEKAKRSL